MSGVVRCRRPRVFTVVLGVVMGSVGCESLRDWTSTSGGMEAVTATAPTTPAVSTSTQGERLGPGAIGRAAVGFVSPSNIQPPGAAGSEKNAAFPIGSVANVSAESAETPAIPPPAQTMSLDLPEALSLAGADNPTIAIARVAVDVALALQLQARALLLPNLNAGMSYDDHEGALQTSAGVIRDVDRQSFYVGAGAWPVGAGTVFIPGVQLYSPLTDAIFAPRIAGDVVTTRKFDARATNNNVLLDVGVLYYALVGAEASLAAVRQTEADIAKVTKLTADFASTGQGRQSDADRARSEALQFHQEEQRAEEEVAVASARLAQVLNIDPSTRLAPWRGPVQLLELVNPDQPIDNLIETALEYRPEMAARAAAIGASQERYRQEWARPFLPTISVGYSTGGFGGGGNQATPSFVNLGFRSDLDVFAFWTWQNLGLGNWALQKNRRAEVRQAEAERVAMINQIRDEVAESVAQSSASRRELSVAQRKLQLAQDGFQRDLNRVRGLVGLPIEVLNSARLLASARQEYVRAFTRFNQAQLRLFVALGQPPTEAGPVINSHASCGGGQ